MIGIIPKLKVDYVPVDSPNRPGTSSDIQWITVHNTANPNSTAQNERDYVAWRPDKASFHYAVDDKEAIAIIPEEEIAWHTGTAEGNRTSIGIEICESGDQEKTYKHAVGFIAKLLNDRNWGADRLRTHKSWSGKECPRRLLSTWDKFLKDVEMTLNNLRKDIELDTKDKWKLEGIEYLAEKGLLNDLKGWTEKINDPMPVWGVTLLLKNVHQDLMKKLKGE
ncbi:peptidoglycan recognition protein family protein [Natronincola ferrireducens]|uniref:N-acetylmuramoyl-L-alanine amidase n=1 Tax=Natronincola ferrireducens TaxID=393762 RepID=A0A1G9E269_9FIRM|nr:N-acetylmuramoyl-L-alanine amidase [Natronincola ferrireducens]SDK70177.1 N-acetylmuramoyl-L-alanine amidase [Natronincola ferrireducens]